MITLKRNAHMTPLQPPAVLVLLWGDFGRVNLAYIRDGKAGGPSSAAIAAAKTAAVLRSLVASCDLVKVDPFARFHDAPSRIANDPMTPLDELLPHRWSPAKPLIFGILPGGGDHSSIGFHRMRTILLDLRLHELSFLNRVLQDSLHPSRPTFAI